MEDRERMAAEAVAIYEELFETFKGRLSSDPKWTESRMHELMDATFDEVRGLDLPGVSTSDEVIVRASEAARVGVERASAAQQAASMPQPHQAPS